MRERDEAAVRSAADLPDAQRPIGRFIADRVLPRWEQLNEYPRATSHQAFVTKQLQRRGFTVLTLPGSDRSI
ncbi:hypothetical protein [Nesterenkonia pannonica]|uniref:hypothetical protein n=1 Tax=Nesterenkonia pannonica TaxID=1548602 RepID=UPI002164ED0D|nr:hypothetical protein [Nesterenkonia pannonica]